jgi:dolichol-phosphate mannosyltransferase
MPSVLDVQPGAGRAAAVAQARRNVAIELRRTANWLQLLSFCAVGASGYVVNLAVYSALLGAGAGFVAGAVGSFAVAVGNNYALNRLITFRSQRATVAIQGARYLSVSLLVLAVNLLLLTALVWGGLGEFWAQAAAIVLVTPMSFLGNKFWSFRA